MSRPLLIVAALLVGYLVGAFGGGWLVTVLSANTHDRSVEAAMTGAFVLGPMGALAGVIAALWWGRARTRRLHAAQVDEPCP